MGKALIININKYKNNIKEERLGSKVSVLVSKVFQDL